MLRQVAIKASEVHRDLGELLRRVHASDEHLIVGRDGIPVTVLRCYPEYRKPVREYSVAAL